LVGRPVGFVVGGGGGGRPKAWHADDLQVLPQRQASKHELISDEYVQ